MFVDLPFLITKDQSKILPSMKLFKLPALEASDDNKIKINDPFTYLW